MVRIKRRRVIVWAALGSALGIALAAGIFLRKPSDWLRRAEIALPWSGRELDVAAHLSEEGAPSLPLELVPNRPNTIRFVAADSASPPLKTYTVQPAPAPDPLMLNGSLSLDPSRFVRVHSRFAGEVRRLGTAEKSGHPLRYGDSVRAGQVLAVIWSKDIGEKKSELIDAISKRYFDKATLDRLLKIKEGVVTLHEVNEAQRNYQGDLVAVARAERTLRSWRLTEEEIAAVRREAEDVRNGRVNGEDVKTWAETEVVAAIDGTILEKSFNVGDIVDTAQDLFKIVDLSRIQVVANVYEEDIPALRRLPPDRRQWRIDLKSDPFDVPMTGSFDLIGSIIDPNMHTGAIMGYVGNKDRKLAVGQFVTATIDLPADPALVAIPAGAIVDEGENAIVFVEADSRQHAFTRRGVQVARRGRDLAYVVSSPSAEERVAGAEPLRAQEKVLISSVLEVAVQLKKLQGSDSGNVPKSGSAPKNDLSPRKTDAAAKQSTDDNPKLPLELVANQPDTIRFVNADTATSSLQTYAVQPAPPPSPLRLPGSLSLDPSRFLRVHSRFAGEVRRLGTVEGAAHPLRFGDRVRAGQVLAVIWSKDIGEKKSELVDAMSRLYFDKAILDRLTKVKAGVVTMRAVNEAQRNYQADLVAVARAERTLRSWRLTDDEIESVRHEAEGLRDGTVNVDDDKTWAETDVIAAIDGTILEKSFNVGDIVDTTQDLFKIADLSRLQVVANVYEEDIPALRRLPSDGRRWRVDLKSDPFDAPMGGAFELIGNIIDTNMHTGVVMGYVENKESKLAAGQFVTATVDLPADPTLVAVPVSAVVEEGSATLVFVETDAARRAFTRRRVLVTQRGRDLVYIVSKPDAAERAKGAEPLRPGEKVLVSSVLEVDGELNILGSSAPKR